MGKVQDEIALGFIEIEIRSHHAANPTFSCIGRVH